MCIDNFSLFQQAVYAFFRVKRCELQDILVFSKVESAFPILLFSLYVVIVGQW